jgi:subtilase-type serine protease
VADGINVAHGVLQPGVAPKEAERAADEHVVPGNVLNVGGDVRIGGEGRLAATISGDSDYTSVRAAGDLVLHGNLQVDAHGTLTPGTVLTIMSGAPKCPDEDIR